MPSPSEATIITTHLERQRDVLLAAGDPLALHRDLELHLLSIGAKHDPFTLQLLKDGLSALSFYMVSRPRFDTFGWTISLQEPSINLFFTGSAGDCAVIGRAFLEHVQPSPRNLFISQIVRPRTETQTSSVEVDGVDIFGMVEHYAAKSDQQPLRFFHGQKEEILLVVALPQADRDWLAGLSGEEAFRLCRDGDLKLISEHAIQFKCGCRKPQILSILVSLYRESPEELFRGDGAVEAECPRCGTSHTLERAEFDAACVASGNEDRPGPAASQVST